MASWFVLNPPPGVQIVLASVGDVDRACNEIRKAGTYRQRALVALVTGLGRRDDLGRAEAVLEGITTPHDRMRALVTLAGTVGAERVYPLVQKIKDQRDRVAAIIAIAEHAKPGMKQWLLAEAVQLGHWAEPMTVLSKDNLEPLLEIVDEYTDQLKPK